MISVIVPVYNVERYLNKCVDSIISQEYKDLEIILVDDGSTDNSGKICDEYADKDERVKVIHKKNGGAADSRNAGLKISTGELIGFIDSDDTISPKMYSRLYGVLEKYDCDIVECRYIKTEKNDLVLNEPVTEPVFFDAEQAVLKIIGERVLTQTPVNKLYKREIALSEPFLKGVYSEDEFWTYKVYSRCKKTAFIDERLYYYYQRPGSKINSAYSLKRLDALEALGERIRFVEERFPALTAYARSSYMGECFYAYQRLADKKNTADKGKEHRKKIYKSFCEEWKKERIKPSKFKAKMWYALFRHLPDFTCFVRNLFGIGL